jgi:hypothetical protein
MEEDKLYKSLEFIKPTKSFANDERPKAPDYSNMDNWAAYPEKNGHQFLTPDQSFTVNKTNNDVDVFYIHPTGFFGKTWNSNMDKTLSAYERTEIMLGNQATVFNDSCNIYAPEYRQATYYSFFAKDLNGMAALDLAYEDIENSFTYFIENLNFNKPFIIAGHSQGAILAHRLLVNKIQGTALQERMICTYAIGYIIPEIHYNDLFPLIPASKNFDDTNCIVSWSTVVEGFKREREKTVFWRPSGWTVELMKQKIVATNPFSWSDDSNWVENNASHLSIINKASGYDFADRLAVHNTGTQKTIAVTKTQAVSASLNSDSGLVELRGPIVERMRNMAFFTGDLHSFDVMLFWGSFRQNVKDRINAFL